VIIAILLLSLYVLGVLVTGIVGARLSRSESDTDFVALSALMWPIFTPIIVVVGGAILLVSIAQRWGR